MSGGVQRCMGPFSGQAPRSEEVPVPRSLGIIELGEIRREIIGTQSVEVKILKNKELTSPLGPEADSSVDLQVGCHTAGGNGKERTCRAGRVRVALGTARRGVGATHSRRLGLVCSFAFQGALEGLVQG
jgi:hypothetical protein